MKQTASKELEETPGSFPLNQSWNYLDCWSPPGKASSQDIGVRNNAERQQHPQRQQPDKGAPAAIAAVTVITGGANQRDEEEAQHRTDACEQNQGHVR